MGGITSTLWGKLATVKAVCSMKGDHGVSGQVNLAQMVSEYTT